MIRYVRKDRRIYAFSLCKACGTAGGCGPDGCTTMICKACSTPQCSVNGLGQGACGICLIGILPGWSGANRPCGYKGCEVPAAAFAKRLGRVCRNHFDRAELTEYIARILAERLSQFEAVEVSQ